MLKFILLLCITAAFYGILFYFICAFYKKQKQKEKEVKYATKYGKLLAEENPKGFFYY